jgi:hypothetical protein
MMSKSTFDDFRRRLEADRPEGCDAVEAGLTALATGAREPEAERHAATCARCRDRVDQVRDLWRRLEWPASTARFRDLEAKLVAPLPFRGGRAVAAALLVAAVAVAFLAPAGVPDSGNLARRLERDGWNLKAIADLRTERAARTLAAIGGSKADALLLGMMGRSRAVDEVAAAALTGADRGPVHPAEIVRRWRPDLLPALIDAAPPGSASMIVPALFDPRLSAAAARALGRLPWIETEAALEWAGLGASPDEAGALAELGIAVPAALKAAMLSADHRTRCFWSAVSQRGGLEFLLAAAGTPILSEDAFRFLDLLPAALVVEAVRDALRDPELAGGAARAAARLGDRSLVPALMRAARNRGAEVVGLEIADGPLLGARSVTLESVCLDAVAVLTSTNP